MKLSKIFILAAFILCFTPGFGQKANVIERFLNQPGMEHASFACLATDISHGKTIGKYQPDLQLTPASVLKLLTTATALELLGETYRFPTTISYEGTITNGVLNGNIYIQGHGDPTLGSSHFAPESETFINQWKEAIREKGIREIKGAIIADESIFDNEGISMKWVREDLGSYYGAGSYGLSFHDNLYALYLKSGAAGTRPNIIRTEPDIDLDFHNYLKAAAVKSDSSYIVGMPFSDERYLYGVVPANRTSYRLKGDIPEPALYLAQYVQIELEKDGISIQKEATCYRILYEKNAWKPGKRTEIITTYSPTLQQIVEKTNHVSHNLFADALLKTIGLRYKNPQKRVISSFEKGIEVMKSYWKSKGLDVSSLRITDGSGLASANKVTAHFLNDLLIYMAKSKHANAFMASLPQAGVEGSVRNFLKDTALSGKAFLKSGSMSGVRCYAGYVKNQGKTYSIVLLTNNYSMNSWSISRRLEQVLLGLFGQ